MSPQAIRRRQPRVTSLEQAASTIFALTTLLPFLIFVWILDSVDGIKYPRAQVGLGLSLLISLLGFVVLRITMRRTSEVLRLLVRAEHGLEPSPHSDPPSGGAGVADSSREAPHAGTSHTTASAATDSAPAIGSIRELREAAEVVLRRWKREAEPLIGRPVVVSVVNLEAPESGTLVRITDDGLILEQDGLEFGVLWRLVVSVRSAEAAEAETTPV
jgi:hypothetical protein